MNEFATLNQDLFLQTLIIGYFTISFIYCVSGASDLFVDLVSFWKKLGPKKLSALEKFKMERKKQKNIAIMIPAYMEGKIIDRMLLGNSRHLNYFNYHFFVGIYPNDPLSIQKLEKLEQKFSHIHGVINPLPGPTSKGQMLNCIVANIIESEKKLGVHFDALHMQDAEDLIHPECLHLINWKLDKYDFIQIPVFSLDLKFSQFVSGTYIDEFAESHTKDILVRDHMQAFVPSAGVGTCLKRNLVDAFLSQNLNLYNEASLTEDYELGFHAYSKGFKSTFACYYWVEDGKKNYIATREYFPKNINRAIRQKTRWTIGISLQGWRNTGWSGSISNRYFQFRDRIGIITNISALAGYPLLMLMSFILFRDEKLVLPNSVYILAGINAFFMLNRYCQRFRCTWRVYGFQQAVMVLFRWPVAILINACATFRAIYQDSMSRLKNVRVAWSKTEHELPVMFGK